MVIEASAQNPASKKAWITVRPDSRIAIEPSQCLVISRVALGQNFDLVLSVLGNPSLGDLGRKRLERDRLGLQISAQFIERGQERGDHGRMRARAHRFIAVRKFREVVREPVGSGPATPGLRTRRLLQVPHRRLECGNVIGVRRRLLVRVRPQRRLEYGGELTDGGELGLLITWNEILDRLYARNLRQLGQLLRDSLHRLLARRQHIDRARPDRGIAAQLQERRNRLDLRTSKIERIEVELQPIQQWQSGRDHEPGANDDRNPVPLHRPIEGREEREAHSFRFTRRAQEHQQCGDHGDAGDERDDHSEAGEQAEL
jgi:hypothetical protein